jgi:dTDP-glucose pyrophosphorylase
VIKSTINKTSTLVEAVSVIEGTTKRLAVVIDKNNKVIGTLTDGDIRRAILKGVTLDNQILGVMNENPAVASVDESDVVLSEMLVNHNIRAIPLLDGNQQYVRTFYETELYDVDSNSVVEKTFVAAVIMAGGEGSRLRPITENIPKPMVDINGIPLLERQIRSLKNIGIDVIYLSINYLGDIIKDYFGNGEKFGVKIYYLNEDKKLGTAGALSLLPDIGLSHDLLIMNGDILTTSDFVNLYHFHKEHNSKITISAINYHVEIPYGVIQSNGPRVIELQEKPSHRFFCNAGIYAVSTDILAKVPVNMFWNMTDLVDRCLLDNDIVSVFPVHEYWSDIGTLSDLDKARKEHIKYE